jgi:hypothetical protein
VGTAELDSFSVSILQSDSSNGGAPLPDGLSTRKVPLKGF